MEQLVVNVRGVNVSCTIANKDAVNTLVFLHGFTGSANTWLPIIQYFPQTVRCISIDLMGHGQSDSPPNPIRYEMNEQLLDLKALLTALDVTKFTLVGYSMGGRIALAYALSYPDGITQLILESASPGLKTEQEQQMRVIADGQLVQKIDKEGLSAFIDFWQEIPLFYSQKKLSQATQELIRQERIQQSSTGLMNSLKGIGTGRQPSYWQQLNRLQMPVILVTGELDEKFNHIAQQMNQSIPNSLHLKVSDVGHAIHVENPVQFATIIKEQMK